MIKVSIAFALVDKDIVLQMRPGEGFRRDDLRRWKTAETVIPQAIRGVKFQGTEFQQRYPDLKIGTDVQVDADGFIIAEPASARHFEATLS